MRKTEITLFETLTVSTQRTIYFSVWFPNNPVLYLFRERLVMPALPIYINLIILCTSLHVSLFHYIIFVLNGDTGDDFLIAQ